MTTPFCKQPRLGRWFNLRDSDSGSPAGLVGPTFATDGLLRSDYTPKAAFSAYRTLVAKLGASVKPPRHRRSARDHHR